MPKVYVPNSGQGHDFTPARKFGDLVVVSEGMIDPYRTGMMVRLWDQALKDSSADDYIIVTGLASFCMIGAGMFADRHRRLNLLLFANGVYHPREISLTRLQDEK